jgi:hypothetical protein
MGYTTISIPIPPGGRANLVEGSLVHGPEGARERFAAIGASEEFFDLAIRRREVSALDDDDQALRLGIVNGDELEIGWMSAGG